MLNLNAWDIAIVALAGYVAILTLVRLMRHRRDEVLAKLEVQVAFEQKRKRAESRRSKQSQARDQRMNLHSPPRTEDPSAA